MSASAFASLSSKIRLELLDVQYKAFGDNTWAVPGGAPFGFGFGLTGMTSSLVEWISSTASVMHGSFGAGGGLWSRSFSPVSTKAIFRSTLPSRVPRTELLHSLPRPSK